MLLLLLIPNHHRGRRRTLSIEQNILLTVSSGLFSRRCGRPAATLPVPLPLPITPFSPFPLYPFTSFPFLPLLPPYYSQPFPSPFLRPLSFLTASGVRERYSSPAGPGRAGRQTHFCAIHSPKSCKSVSLKKCWAVWVFTDSCSSSYMDDMTDVDRYCHIKDDKTVRL